MFASPLEPAMPARPPTHSPADDDRRWQQAALGALLDAYPAALHVDELARELDVAASADPLDRAVRDLAGAGLLHRHGPFVLPTRAAVHAAALLG
jgi:hypothetical protein